MDEKRKLKVLCPVEGKDNKTYWKPMGAAFRNKDDSITVLLDGFPVNGKLQLREWEDDPRWQQQRMGLPPVAGGPSNPDMPF